MTASVWILPREHGAWGMLALPFLSALAVARRVDWDVLPAAVAAVAVFLVREPVVILARKRPEAPAARRTLFLYTLAAAASSVVLLWRLPARPLVALGAAAMLLTALAVWLAIRNQQRSVLLQVVSAAGLTASAVLAWLAVHAELDSRIWWLWGLQFGHSAGAILTVRARLEARIAARGVRGTAVMRPAAWVAQGLLIIAAVICLTLGRTGPAVALSLSALVHGMDLARMANPVFLQMPLRRVGFRELFLSVGFSALVVAALWV